jgi:hypothetical protein
MSDPFLYLLFFVALLWTMFWGLVPPVLSVYWAYRVGSKQADISLKEAIKTRDMALERVDALVAKTDIVKALKTPDPETGQAPLDEIRQALTATIDGKIGQYVRQIKDAQGENANPALSLIGSFFKKK